MIRSFDGYVPEIAASAYVDESATVVGDVTIGDDVSVWPGAVLRGDRGRIVLEEGANVQDNATVHEGAEIGPYSTVGHNAIVHAATVGRRCMVGMGAIVLDDSRIGDESLVGANSVVTEGTEIPDSSLAVGTPAEVIKEVEDSYWHDAADRYIELSSIHEATGDVLDREKTLPER